MGVTFVRRELVEVAEIDRFKGRRKKAEYEEPCVRVKKVCVSHTHTHHGSAGTHWGLPMEAGVLGSTSVKPCSRFGVWT